ncbi:P-loop containing nucleoside triphosphate hydrolase superfamily protein [Trifolium repens]|nr:P-loop containing nucleoside triphosphate hydrolase superfamily protein [Trifolium repens]
MEQKHVLLSALSVGVGLGVGLGLSSGQTVQKWVGGNRDFDEVSGEQIVEELKKLLVDGKDSKVTFDEFPYYLSERTRVLLTSAAYVHLKHLNFSKHTRNLSPASRAILLSGPAELYQQMLAKALAHYFESKLLLLDITDFSLKLQSRFGFPRKVPSLRRSISEMTMERMSGLFGSFSMMSSTGETRGTLRQQTVDSSNNPPRLRRNASAASDLSSSSSQTGSINPAPLRRTSSLCFDEKLFVQSLYKVLVSISGTDSLVISANSLSQGLSLFQEGKSSGNLKTNDSNKENVEDIAGAKNDVRSDNQAPENKNDTSIPVTKKEGESSTPAKAEVPDNEFEKRIRPEVIPANEIGPNEQILVLAATNRPFDLDEAIIRRFERRIMVSLPSVENREMILKTLLSKEKHDEKLDFKELATMTEGFSGSDLKNLCITAAYRPVRELIQQERNKEMEKKKKEAESVSSEDASNSNDNEEREITLRSLNMEDMKQAKNQVAASFASEGSVMAELKQWNELYGEGGSRKKQQLTYFL